MHKVADSFFILTTLGSQKKVQYLIKNPKQNVKGSSNIGSHKIAQVAKQELFVYKLDILVLAEVWRRRCEKLNAFIRSESLQDHKQGVVLLLGMKETDALVEWKPYVRGYLQTMKC